MQMMQKSEGMGFTALPSSQDFKGISPPANELMLMVESRCYCG